MSHPQRGHLPIGAPVRFRVGDHVLADGDRPEDGGWRIIQIIGEPAYAVLRSSTGAEMLAMLRVLRPYAVTPDLADIVSDAANLGEQMIATLGRPYDPASAPEHDPRDPWPSDTDIRLGNIVGDIRSALDGLARIPGPPLPDALDEGDGPPSHRVGPGEDPRRADAGEATPGPAPTGRLSRGPGVGFDLPQPKPFEVHVKYHDAATASDPTVTEKLRDWLVAALKNRPLT